MMEKMKVFNKFPSFKKLLISLLCLYFLACNFWALLLASLSLLK